MSFVPRPIDSIELVSYDTLVQLEAVYDKFHGGQCFIKHLLGDQAHKSHLDDVIIPAANILEPRLSDGMFLDAKKRRASAVVAGGLIAGAIVNLGGGGYVLDNLTLPESQKLGRDKQGRELEDIGSTAYFSRKYGLYSARIQTWEGELADPIAQGHLRIGFGLVMHLADQEIKRLQLPTEDFRLWDRQLAGVDATEDRE